MSELLAEKELPQEEAQEVAAAEEIVSEDIAAPTEPGEEAPAEAPAKWTKKKLAIVGKADTLIIHYSLSIIHCFYRAAAR